MTQHPKFITNKNSYQRSTFLSAGKKEVEDTEENLLD